MLTYCVVWGDNWTGNKITAQWMSVSFKIEINFLCELSSATHFYFICVFVSKQRRRTYTPHIRVDVFFWMRTWLNEIKRGVSLSFQCCTDTNKERTEGEPLFIFSVRGEPLFLLSDSDIDTNRHQSDDVTSPKLDLAVTMVMSCYWSALEYMPFTSLSHISLLVKRNSNWELIGLCVWIPVLWDSRGERSIFKRGCVRSGEDGVGIDGGGGGGGAVRRV